MRELRTTDKLIITVATTGLFQGKESNPNFPILHQEIAQSVYEAWNEGASIAHIHARERNSGVKLMKLNPILHAIVIYIETRGY